MPTLTIINRNMSNNHNNTHQHSIRLKWGAVFFGVNMILLLQIVDLFGGDIRSGIQCTLIRKAEILDRSEALPRIVRLANLENTPVAVPSGISSNCFEFYRPDGKLVVARERFSSVHLLPPAKSNYRIVPRGSEDIDLRIDNDCRVRRVKGGVIVESILYEWQLDSGDYIIVVRCDAPSAVYSNGREVLPTRAFEDNVRIVNILSNPILVRVP